MSSATLEDALAVYEKAVAKETIGSLGDALNLYRNALRINKDVEKAYRKKLQIEYQLEKEQSLRELTNELESVSLEDEQEEEDLIEDPCWLLEILPDDIVLEIVKILIYIDPYAHYRLSATCHKLNKLCFSTEAYQALCTIIYPAQIYSPESTQLKSITPDQHSMVKRWEFDWKQMMEDRPFIKYHGCYISKISYISEGSNENSFYNPVKLVTYFRYLRFYPDGTVLSLTTTDEPPAVVPIFRKEDFAILKDSYVSRFDLSIDGTVKISSSEDKYKFLKTFQIVNLGDRKFHRLNWISSSVLKDEILHDLNFKKERPFNFSNVKSYNVELDSSS